MISIINLISKQKDILFRLQKPGRWLLLVDSCPTIGAGFYLGPGEPRGGLP
jgi:hypothetical protein